MTTQAFLDLLFARAKQAGIEACEAYLTDSESFEASVNASEVIEYSVASSMGLGFRALVGGKVGYASTQVLDEAAADLLVSRAKDNALSVESADEQMLFPGSAAYPPLETYNPALDALAAADKIKMALELEKRALAVDPRLKQVDGCAVVSSSDSVRIKNSLGLDVSHRGNVLLAYVMPVAKDGDKVNSAFEFAMTRDPRALDLDKLAQAAAGQAIDGLTGAPVPSGGYPVVIENTSMAALLSAFAGVFSADSAQKGLSRLQGREGESIASSIVTLLDDPFHPDGTASAPFDAEGVATYRKPVIERGALNTLLHNLKTAKKQGLSSSTANASKSGYAGPIGVAPGNFYFEPGALALDGLMGQAEGGIVINELQGLHSGTNPVSGDFSLAAKGYRIEQGQKGAPVNQITLSGNFFELLKSIVAVGNDLRFPVPGFVEAGVGSPSVLVRELSVAGE